MSNLNSRGPSSRLMSSLYLFGEPVTSTLRNPIWKLPVNAPFSWATAGSAISAAMQARGNTRSLVAFM